MKRMADVNLFNYTVNVKNAISGRAYRAVEEACGELESQTKRNTAVDTGQTKNAWSHYVKQTENETIGTVGNPLENSIWEELGTGEYALNGDGRKGGWSYCDERGVWHHTMGKHPRRAFYKAYTSLKKQLIKHMQDTFKGGLS